MTDKEIAFELGKKLLEAKFRIAAMAGEMDRHRDSQTLRQIPWRQYVEETLSQDLSHVFQQHIDELSRELDAASPEGLLRSLYNSIDAKRMP
ncbi:MAG: hypothetical protein ABSB50_13570 [Terracidiphilus sp.]